MLLIGFGESLTKAIVEHYGSEETAQKAIDENPYCLMDVEGISFKRADNHAQLTGIADNDPRRQRAIVQYTFQNATSLGHTYLPFKELKKEVKKLDKTLNETRISEILQQELTEGRIIEENENEYYWHTYYNMELDVAGFIKERLTYKYDSENEIDFSPVKNDEYLRNRALELDLDQQNFVKNVKNHNICILTGGPGTGKTHVTSLTCDILSKLSLKIGLCAPTGKAAQRMQELTKREAKTIHRMLRASFFKWGYNSFRQLTAYDVIIVDESSMLDLHLSWRLLQALPTCVRIVFVGDKDQLAPVGPGNFFKDIINCHLIPTYILKTNHRQGKGSGIANLALQMNRGAMQISFNDFDMLYVESPNPIEARTKILKLIKELQDEGFSTDDIQVLTPQHSTVVGVKDLNILLRSKLNLSAKPGEKFSVGDRVMQTVNDYELSLFNGYVGRIANLDKSNYYVNFFDDSRESVTYPRAKDENLQLAYASTVHKFQGSEMPAGIVVCSSGHSWMLTRNLIYTAITRFKKKCIIVGDKMALRRSITNTREQERFTRLVTRLRT